MKIITIPNPILRQVSLPITPQTKHLSRILDQLKRTLLTTDSGVGLAAPQLGHHLRIFALNLPSPGDKSPSAKQNPAQNYQVYLNPHLSAHSSNTTLYSNDPKNPDFEGCLSVPNIYAPIPRYEWVDLTYDQIQDGQFIPHTQRFSGYPARAVQHELDHLDGLIFIDHALAAGSQLYRGQSKKDQLEPITIQEFYDIFGKDF